MQAIELMQELLKRAKWQGEPLALEAAHQSCTVALDSYNLNFAVFKADELYIYVELPLPKEGKEEERYATMRRAAQVCAHIWQDHPFYLGYVNKTLRAELILNSNAAEPDKDEESLAIFLDDVDYLCAQLQGKMSPTEAGLSIAQLQGTMSDNSNLPPMFNPNFLMP